MLEELGERRGAGGCRARHVSIPVDRHEGILTRAIRELDAADVRVDDIGFRRPTLDDVSCSPRHRPARAEESAEEVGA